MLSSNTLIYGIIGNPVRHSLSPIIHNKAFKRIGKDAVYLTFEVNDLQDAIKGIRALGIRGVSVTIPFKSEVISYLDEVEQTAKKIKAVNTILNNEGVLIGYNTDWIGAIEALKEMTDLDGKRVLILGAGGSARAVVYGLKESGSHVIITNRSPSKAKELAEEFGCMYLENALILGVDIVINCTPVGMYPMEKETPLPKEALREGMIVMDLVYYPLRTRLLKEAEEMGCKTIDGLSMLSHQAALQFRLWTGIKPNIREIKNDLKEALERNKNERD